LAITGELDLNRLNAERAALTRDDWLLLANRVASEADSTQRTILNIVDATFSYNRQTAPNNEAQVESQAAALDVERQFLQEILNRQRTGNPMTASQQQEFANSLIAARETTYRQTLSRQLSEYISRNPGLPPLRPGSELADLDAWFGSLENPSRSDRTNYERWRFRISEYMTMIGGN